MDEKRQIQVLDRTAPIFPMLPGTRARATHDYRRNGTASLFATLDVAPGKVIGSLHARHRAIEFKKFLRQIDERVPAELDVHLILDSEPTRPPIPTGMRPLLGPSSEQAAGFGSQ